MLLEIKPEIEAVLSRQAAAHGVDLNSYAASLLEDAVGPNATASATDVPSSRRSLREVFEAVRGLADDVDFVRKPSTRRPVDFA